MLALVAALGLAAPVPPDEPPKPRAKLLGSVKVDRPVYRVAWTADGKHAVLFGEGKGLIVPREQFGDRTPAKPVGEFDLPEGMWTAGVTPDGSEVYAVMSAGGQFNAEGRLLFWNVKELLDGKKKAKPDRSVSLEVDNPAGFAFAADGKTAFVSEWDQKPTGGPNNAPRGFGRVVRASLKTGDVKAEVAAFDADGSSYIGSDVHPASDRLFAVSHTADEYVIRCLDTDTKKEKWERKYPPPAPNAGGTGPRVSPDGSTVVVFLSRVSQKAQPGVVPPGAPAPPLQSVFSWSPHLLNATTGEEIAELGNEETMSCDALGYSADGKLLFGWVTQDNRVKYMVWEAKTGKPLKTWARGSGLPAAAFAPTGHALLVVEPIEKAVPQPRQVLPLRLTDDIIFDSNPRDSTVVMPLTQTVGAVVGLWDLAPLVK